MADGFSAELGIRDNSLTVFSSDSLMIEERERGWSGEELLLVTSGVNVRTLDS